MAWMLLSHKLQKLTTLSLVAVSRWVVLVPYLCSVVASPEGPLEHKIHRHKLGKRITCCCLKCWEETPPVDQWMTRSFLEVLVNSCCQEHWCVTREGSTIFKVATVVLQKQPCMVLSHEIRGLAPTRAVRGNAGKWNGCGAVTMVPYKFLMTTIRT